MKYEVKPSQHAQPLATFDHFDWADEWRHKHCNTGLVFNNEAQHFCEPKLPHGLAPEHRFKCDECGCSINNIIATEYDGGTILCEECAAL